MGRAGLVIDKTKLTQVINELESQSTFENRSRLYEAVCKTAWASSEVKDSLGRSHALTPANVNQYVNKFGIVSTLKTPVGKRGNPNIGKKLTPEERKNKISKRPGYIKTMSRLKFDIKNHFGSIPESMQRLLDRAGSGNKSAIVKLKCLECCNWQASECSKCTVYGCPIYLINPFIHSTAEQEEEHNESE